jgi:hypothetical protein
MNLGDPTLRISAELLDDLEGNRIANENRLRQLTRAETDSDGEERGFGLTDDHPVVARVTHLVEGLLELEKEAIANLQKIMRAHPLGPWVKRQPGIGEKQMARLLAAIGDPYIRPVQEKDGVVQQPRPRSVSELWAYSGMHVWDLPIEGAEGQRTDDAHGTIAPGHRTDDAQMPSAEGLPTIDAHDPHAPGQPSSDNHPPSAPGQTNVDTHTVTAGIAPFRQRGRRLNWSEDARKRVRLIADSCVKQPNGTVWRDIYTAGREKYANAVHKRPCKRCGPSGKPARIGSPLSEGHKDARARRLVAKEILKELWREAGRLHGQDTAAPAKRDPTPILQAPVTQEPPTPIAPASPATETSTPNGDTPGTHRPTTPIASSSPAKVQPTPTDSSLARRTTTPNGVSPAIHHATPKEDPLAKREPTPTERAPRVRRRRSKALT